LGKREVFEKANFDLLRVLLHLRLRPTRSFREGPGIGRIEAFKAAAPQNDAGVISVAALRKLQGAQVHRQNDAGVISPSSGGLKFKPCAGKRRRRHQSKFGRIKAFKSG
jgi:hypothetical protein